MVKVTIAPLPEQTVALLIAIFPAEASSLTVTLTEVPFVEQAPLLNTTLYHVLAVRFPVAKVSIPLDGVVEGT